MLERLSPPPSDKYVVRKIETPGHLPCWYVELTSAKGSLCIASFIGDMAEQRANEYAHWKNGGTGSCACPTVDPPAS